MELEPRSADAWACLSICVLDEYHRAFNTRPNALERALVAARRGVAADPANQLAAYALAQAHYFRGDFEAFRSVAERAISLNPRDGNTMAMMGTLTAYGGDWARGLELTTGAIALNPHRPGWYRFPSFWNAYRQRRHADALEIVQSIHLPDYFATHYMMAMAHAQLGNLATAKAARERTLQMWPEFDPAYVEKWIRNQPDLIAHVVDGLGKAGFRIPGGASTSDES